MTDQLAAPFGVAKARALAHKYDSMGEGVRVQLCRTLIAACDRIDYLDFHWRKSTDREAIASIRAEAAEARVKELTDELDDYRTVYDRCASFLADEGIQQTESLWDQVITLHNRLYDAKTDNAALREALLKISTWTDDECDGRYLALKKIADEVLSSPSPGAGLVEELERLRAMLREDKGANIAALHWMEDAKLAQAERDRLAARNEKLERIVALYDTRRSRKLGCRSVDGHGTSGHCDCHNKELETALRVCDEETKPR